MFGRVGGDERMGKMYITITVVLTTTSFRGKMHLKHKHLLSIQFPNQFISFHKTPAPVDRTKKKSTTVSSVHKKKTLREGSSLDSSEICLPLE